MSHISVNLVVVVIVVYISHKHEPTIRLVFNNFAREKKLLHYK
jgi:hypothetical protein